MTSATTIRAATREWIEENPLRKWRNHSPDERSVRMTATMLGTSATSVQNWEFGHYVPNEASMQRIAALIGVDASALYERWNHWVDRRPSMTGRWMQDR